MFNSKKDKLFSVDEKQIKTSVNPFILAAKVQSNVVSSGNGATKFNSTQNIFVDQFSNASAYKKPRTYDEVAKDMAVCWATSERDTIRLVLYFRIITRDVVLNGEKIGVHRGAGLKNESIMRMLWLAIERPSAFYNNISLFIAAGSWCDIIKMLQLDLVYNGWDGKLLDWDAIVNVILAGLENPSTSELVKKYLPQIKAKSKCTTVESQADTLVAKYICSRLFGGKGANNTYKSYRKLKSNGTAHQWQQLISKGKHNLIDFSTIHGRALSLLVSSDYIKNQGLTQVYQKWIAAQPVAKYTGYVMNLQLT